MIKKIALIGVVALTLSGCSMMTKQETSESMSDDKMMAEESMEYDSMEKDGVMVGGAMMVQEKNIVENAVNSDDHTTLVAAVQAAGLDETLQQPGPFTVFAPTNAAFDALPAGTVESLLEPENSDQLTSVLTYHVVPGMYTSADLSMDEPTTLTTVQGQDITISYADGKWWINETAEITIADVISSNGATHVIDAVLLPEEN